MNKHKLSGKTIYLVKSGKDIIFKSFDLEKAKQELKDFNFPIEQDINFSEKLKDQLFKAKLFKATVK